MLQNRLSRLINAGLTIGLLWCAALATEANAQIDPTEPATIRVTEIKTKPGYANVWREMQRDVMAPYFKRSNWPFVNCYRVRFGEASFVVVSDIGTFDIAGESTEEGARQYRTAVRESVEWTRTSVLRKHPGLSFGEPSDAPDERISVSYITIAPDKRGDFIKNFKEIGLPRFKNVGLPSLVTWEILYGHDSGKFVVVTPIENYGDLAEGTPFYRGMSEEERAELLSSMQGVITEIRRSVGDYLADLSFAGAE